MKVTQSTPAIMVNFGPAATTPEAVAGTILLARRLDCLVSMHGWNGVDFTIRPDDSPPDAVRRLNELVHTANEKPAPVGCICPELGIRGDCPACKVAYERGLALQPKDLADLDRSPRIYIAGPFRAETPWEIEQNIRRAEECGLDVARLGGIPIIPHTMYRFFQNALPDAFWLEAGLSILRTCHALACYAEKDDVLRRSDGTRGEYNAACADHQPTFFGPGSYATLALWIANFKKEHTPK